MRSSAAVRHRQRAAFALLLCLIALVAAAPQGLLGMVGRFAAVSFDNPASQILDELTCEKASPTDRLLEATERLRAGAAASQRLTTRERAAADPNHVLDALAARAPPAA